MKILFAVDGSQCSKAAIATALTMRCPAGTELMVVSAVDFLEPLPSLEGIKNREIAETEKLVHAAVEQLRKTHPHAVVTGAVRNGYAYEEILETCKEWKPDLLMLGSHGRTGINFLMTGSVSRAMLQEAPCAVRVIRARSEEHTQSDIYNVILALDDSEHSQTMIDHVLEFPWSEYTTFKCVNVVHEIHRGLLTEAEITPAEVLSEHYNDMVAGNKAWLEVASQKLNNKFGKRVAKAEVLLGEPRQALLELAKTWPADLIVMGSHGRRGFEKAIIGSVSEAVAMHASCSVEIIRIKSLAKKKVHFIV
jgi:nucleotide-binding universal stress UspA family protein